MSVSVLYQGHKFEVDPELGDRHDVQDYIQQRLMMNRFIESAWVDGDFEDLPAAWLPAGRGDDSAQMTVEMSAAYTMFPDNAGEAVVHRPFVAVPLADGSVLSVLVHDALSLAVIG